MKKIISLFSLLFLLSFSTLLSAVEPRPLEPVTLQLKWKTQFQFAGYYAALEQGYFAQEGLDISILPLTKPKNIINAVVTGKINYAIGGSGILAQYAKGKPIKALAAIFQHDALVFIAKQSSGIISPYEMADKRIMFDGTTGDDAPLTAMLADTGLSPKDYINIPPSFSNQTLINNETDIMSGYLTDQPFSLKVQGIDINIINPQNYGFDFYGDILYTSDLEIENNPGRVERFKRASLKGWEYALAHPEELIQVLKNKYHSELSIEALRYEAQATQKLILPNIIPLGQLEIKRLRRVADTYANLNLAPPLSDVSLKSFILKSTPPIILSDQERAWLAAHPVIRVGIDRDYAPYEWVDAEGNYTGLAADYMQLLEDRLGIKFEIVKGKSWAEVLALAKKGELDMLSCLNLTPQRKAFLNFTSSYISNPMVIINASRHGYVGSIEKLNGKTVAVEKNYYMHEKLVSNYPKIKLLIVDSTKNALNKVSTGEANAYIGDAAFSDYAIKKANLLNLQFSGETGDFTAHRVGVIKSHPELLSILNKAFNNIPVQERQAIEQKWMGLTIIQKGISTHSLVEITAVLLFIFLVFIYRNTQLKRSRITAQNNEKHLQSIIDASPIPQVIHNSSDVITHLNKSFIHTFGYTLKEIPTLNDWWPKAYPDDAYRENILRIWRHIQEMPVSSKQSPDIPEAEIHCKNGINRHVLIKKSIVFDARMAETDLHIITLFDISDRKKREENLRHHQEKILQNKNTLLKLAKENYASKTEAFNKIIAASAEQLHVSRTSIWFLNEEKSTLTCNALYNQGSISNDELVLNSTDYPHYFATLDATGGISVNDALTHPDTYEFVNNYLRPLGITSLLNTPIRLQGKLAGIICHEHTGPQRGWQIEEEDFAKAVADLCTQFSLEIDRREAEEKLNLSARVFSDTHEGITITDANQIIIDVNPAFCEITGYSRDEIIGHTPSMLNSGKQSPQFYKEMWKVLNKHRHWQGEIWNRTKHGVLYAELLTVSALTNDNDEVINYVGMFSDITQTKRQQEELTLMAHYDVLTELPNRSLFVDRFKQAIAHSKRTKTQLAVCFLDLDKFKPINDNYGHEAGDQILIEVAQRISNCIREEDTVSRQGGDEFTLLLNDISSTNQCEQTLTRIHLALAQPYLIDDTQHSLSASSGFTLYPDDDGDIDTLLRHADQAMYQSKQLGRNQFHFFNASQDQEISSKHHRLTEIEHALINNELTLYYQPKVNMLTGEVFGAEALIRWIHPEKGLIPPIEFLPVLDGTQLEIQVGNWVISQALQQLDAWNKQDIQLEVSINIASSHLQSAEFFNYLDAQLAEHPTVNSKNLQLEILESSALGDVQLIKKILSNCQSALGVNIALDDFGTGYSSLTHLRSLPANTIKIDQSFVRDILDDPNDYSIVEGVIGLSNAFNRHIIAEGVETTEHGLLLLMLGCQHAQGYGIARPMPATDIELWLNNYTANPEWLLYGKKDYSAKEIKTLSFQLISTQWKNKFVSNMQASPDTLPGWPIMKSRRCHCSHWIQSEYNELTFGEKQLNQLEAAHDKTHTLAQTLQTQYLAGDIQAARDGLSELQTTFDSMLAFNKAM